MKTEAKDSIIVQNMGLIPKSDLRLRHDMHIKRGYLSIRHHSIGNAGDDLIGLLCLIIPFVLCIKGKQLMLSLQKSKSKAKLPFFWATASIVHIFNIYMSVKMLTVGCDYNGHSTTFKVNCTAASIGILYIIITSGCIAYAHSKLLSFAIPRMWGMFTKCCGRKQHKIITTVSLWGIYCSIFILLMCVPCQILLVSSNPHLYGFGILTVWCAMFVCIIITFIPFTIDQIFIKEEEYRITPKQALRQILLLMFIAVLVFGFGSLTFNITLVLHLSKYGEKTQSVSKTINFILRHAVLPIVLWMVQKLRKKILLQRNALVQRLQSVNSNSPEH